MSRRLLFILPFLLLAPALEASPSVDVTLYGVPIQDWQGPETDPESFLEGGTVLYYRAGSYLPEVVGVLGQPTPLPYGDWHWIAHAPGWVTVEAGGLRLGKESGPEATLVWPLVPACRVEVPPSRDWMSASRVDVVALEHGAVYPLHPRLLPSLWVPAGPYLVYAAGVRGLIGISEPGNCRPNDEITLAPIAPPEADRQDLMVSFRLPADTDSPLDTLVVLEPKQGINLPPIPATALTCTSGRLTAFFVGAEARTDRLTVSHRQLRTFGRAVDGRGGQAEDLGELASLRPRRGLTLDLNFAPFEPEASGLLELRRCGLRRQIDAFLRAEDCAESIAEARFRPGPQTFEFSDLDDGQYLLRATIGDEVLEGLGQAVHPYLAPDDHLEPPAIAVELRELEIFGHLLVDGDPIPGQVHLRPDLGSSNPLRSFSTDEELLYRLRYFGRFPRSFERRYLPEDARDLPNLELLGLYAASYTLEACSDLGACRTYNIHSTLTGEGRLDLELGTAEPVDVELVSRHTGDPLPHGEIHYPRSPALHFFAGDVAFELPPGLEGEYVRTDSAGRARLLPQTDDELVLTGYAEGFKPARTRVQLPSDGSVVRIELSPDDAPRGASLRLEDGSPLARAFLLAVDDEGQPDYGCTSKTNLEGFLDRSPTCLEERQVLLLHPSVPIQLIHGRDLAAHANLALEARTSRPLEIAVTRSSGTIPRQMVLDFGDFRLGTNDLLLAMTSTGHRWTPQLDSAGRLTLGGVLPGLDAPDLLLELEDGEIVRVSLHEAEPGQVFDLALP